MENTIVPGFPPIQILPSDTVRRQSIRASLVAFSGVVSTFGIASFLVVADCVAFMEKHDWASVRNRCSELRDRVENEVCQLTGFPSLYGDSDLKCPQMATVELPPDVHIDELKRSLYDKYLVEIPILELEGRKYARASLQAYNDEKDLERLLDGLAALLPSGGC